MLKTSNHDNLQLCNEVVSYIESGWERCKEIGFNRDYIPKKMIVDKEKIEKTLNDKKELIRISKPFMERLYSFVKDTGFVVMLTDEFGCLLSIIGDSEIINSDTYKDEFSVGAVWDERYNGNTAVSTVIKENFAIQLLGDEHYCRRYSQWGCSSAPIRNDGKLVGTLTARGYLKNTHNHTLGMVLASANSIENQFIVEKATLEIIYKNKYQSAIMECINDGFLTIDEKGILTYINKLGADTLGINKDEAIGKHMTELIDFDPIILNVIETGKGYTDREFIIKSKTGATYHFIKTAMPIRDEEGKIVGAVDNFRKIKRVHNMVRNLVGNYAKFTFDDIIGNSPQIRECIRLAEIAAKSSTRVLIHGESGTGKELLVQSIHNASSRKKESLVSINCAAIPSELIESELFGYEKGAFTGALKQGQIGKFELANGGTIFLDEIGDMPLHMQGKLLRVLQENQITRVGGADIIDIDVRIISATNKNLLEECKKGNFREDLFYRLNVFNITAPSLRERKEDIIILVEHLIKVAGEDIDREVQGISADALERLKNYDWPGNVRELKNVIERAVNLSTTGIVELKDLPKILNGKDNNPNISNNIIDDIIIADDGTVFSMEEIENKAITAALRINNGNITQASKMLNVSRNTLYNKIAKYGIE